MLTFKGLLERKGNEIMGIASTENPDRDGEIILQNGWDLEDFKKNPVILASHNYGQFPIGKVTDIAIKDGKLLFTAIFSESTQLARDAYALIKEGILNAFSVGFIPREWQDPEAGQNADSIISKASLLEISVVSVPANAEAIVLAKGMKDNALAKEIVAVAMKNKKTAAEVEAKLTETIDVKDNDKIECECGKTYILKLATQPEEPAAPPQEKPKGNEGEDGEGRSEDPQKSARKLVKGALKLLQEFQEISNRKE